MHNHANYKRKNATILLTADIKPQTTGKKLQNKRLQNLLEKLVIGCFNLAKHTIHDHVLV